jgi:signal transduction histidine kinase
MRDRLQFQIFGALAVTVVFCVCVAVSIVSLFREMHPLPRFATDLGEFMVESMPEPRTPAFQHELSRRGRRLGASLSVWDREGHLLGRTGRTLPQPRRFTHMRGHALVDDDAMFVRLGDGRLLGVAFEHGAFPAGAIKRMIFALLFLVFVLLLGSHWAAHRIVRRLALLEATVARFGAGDLSARVELRGRDEIARLGLAFNRNFARIGELLRQQRRMLQSASHELRSPLTRVRMAVELLSDPDLDAGTRDRLRGDAGRDIEELDALIGDLLLAGRLSDTELPRDFASVDFGTICRDEASKVRAEARADSVALEGNARMLRSLVRNLLENARRYGKDPIVLTLHGDAARVRLLVEDAGEGVPEADRERIFEPFYRPAGHREGRDGGVGLGLALVRTIAEHHGGSARYLPREGGGSVFEVELPYTITAEAATSAPA